MAMSTSPAPAVGPSDGAAASSAVSATLDDDGFKQYSHRQILAIMSGLVLGMLLAALDQTIVATALTRISEDFHRQDLYSWVVTAYLLTSTATTPLYGKISDLFGRKRIFQFAIVVFLIGSALSGLSQNMFQLIGFRALQGLGAGGLMSLALSIVGDVIPPRDRGRYQGYFGGVFGASSVLGPLLGGFLVDQVSWRWVFYINLPIGLIALFVINRVLHLDHQRKRARIDFLGAALLVGGVSLLLVAVQNAGSAARVSSTSAIFGVVGLVLIVACFLWERVAAEPILPPSLFRNDVFRVCAALSLITGGVMFGAIIFLPQYMQLIRGVSPTMSGLRLLPLLAGLLFTSITSGQLISRGWGYKKFVVVGTAVLTVGTALLTRIGIGTSFWWISGIMFVVGFGLGLFMQTTILATQNSVNRLQMGVATSAITFSRTLGGAIGSSVLGAILIEHQRTHADDAIAKYGPRLGQLHSFVDAMDRAYLWAIPVAALAFLISFALREVTLRTGAANPGTAASESGVPPAALQHDQNVQRGEAAASSAPAPEAVAESDAGSALQDPSARELEDAAEQLVVSGIVHDASHTPIAHAWLSLTDLEGRQVGRTTSDASGRYRLPAPGPGRYLLVSASEASAPTAEVVRVHGVPVHREIALKDSATVNGWLALESSGEPAVDGSVSLTDDRGNVVASSLVDLTGGFSLSVPAGSYVLTAAAGTGYEPQARRLTARPGETTRVELVLARSTGTLSGIVRAATDLRPLAGATVDVRDDDGTIVATVTTDADGRYTVDVPAGSYTVTARGLGPVTQPLSIGDGTNEFDLELG